MKLHEQINEIKTKEDLADFVAALGADFAADPDSWENPTLECFLGQRTPARFPQINPHGKRWPIF